ncbi:hypothetical protein JTE90_000804 [Oedothorax gibbosus]|uniref:Uncharacterized protein n=1 Tax=Oedothorax gibbosus TaxID=931172 RepID=A0AAV6U329_9ARAC|nr:hypothetical protein JTE90_000804 [Oedothorax gibbosus]
MARFVIVLLLACLASLSMGQRKRREGVYNCYNKNLCNCNDGNSIEFWQECFDKAGPQIQEWYIGEVNKCKGLSKPVQNGPVASWVQSVCALEEEVRKDCYFQLNKRSQEEYQKASNGEYGPEIKDKSYEATECLRQVIYECQMKHEDDCLIYKSNP